MPLSIDNSEHNTLTLPTGVRESLSGKVTFTGRGGSLKIGGGCLSANLSITIGNDCHVVIVDSCILNALEIYTRSGSVVSIGSRSGFTWHTSLHCHEPYNISIGNDCLLASGTMLTVSDMHSLVDVASGELLNPGASILVGDHVWLGQDVILLKGAQIGDGSVVGIRSVITKHIPARSLAVGSPGKVIKSGVTWDFRTPTVYNDETNGRD